MHIANHYIRIGKNLLKKGDLIPSDLPEDKIKWLLEAGAIQEVTMPLKFYGHGELPTVPASEAAEAIPVEADTIEEDAETADTLEDEEDTDIEEEVPEVDVMSGIVPLEDTQPDKKAVASKTGRKRTK